MTGYTDETFTAWYEQLTYLEQYDYDTEHAAPYVDSTTTPQQDVEELPRFTDYTFSCWLEGITDRERQDYDNSFIEPLTPVQGRNTMPCYNAMKIHHSDCDQTYAIAEQLRTLGHAAYSPAADLLLTSARVRLVQSLTRKTVTETTLDVKNISFDEPNAEANCSKAHDTLESKGFYVRFIDDSKLETDCPWYILHRMYAVTFWVEDEEEQD